MNFNLIFALSTVSMLATGYLGFMPWGAASIVFSLIVISVIMLYPSKSIAKANISLAVQGIGYGKMNDATEHLLAAFRELEKSKDMEGIDIEQLRLASQRIAMEFEEKGLHGEAANIRQKFESIESC